MLINPAFMYAGIWAFVLLLYSLGLSDLLEPLKLSTAALVAGTSISFIAGWALESLQYYGRLATSKVDIRLLSKTINSDRVGRRLKVVWIIFCAGIIFEIAYFQGIPLLGLFGIGTAITYADFGIHGFHGFVNSMFFAGCTVAFSRTLLGSSKSKRLLVLMSLGYPVLVMSRQVLISVLLQYLFIYFSFRRPSPVVFIRAGVIFIAAFLIFGYLGDLRTGRENIISVGAPSFEYPDWLPSAFIWFYIYLCTPLNNVNHNIDIVPHYFPLETAGSLIPSFIRDEFLSMFGGARQWDLVTDALNANSLLQSLLTDFGVSGAILFTTLCGVAFSRLLRRSISSPAAFFAVVVLLHGVALSFFANLLFQLVFISEICAISWVMARRRS